MLVVAKMWYYCNKCYKKYRDWSDAEACEASHWMLEKK